MGIKDERKFENLNKLIQILLDHPHGLTKSEIARRLGVHRSTAAEYIRDLGAPAGLNVPVYEASPGRFTIDRDHYQVKISVDMHEALALHLAARLLTTRTDKHYPHAASALRKLGMALEKLAPLVSLHMKHSANVLDGEHRRKDSAFIEVLETLTRAWASGHKVKITHEMDDRQTFAYTFSPYFIEPYAIGRTMHVIGYREPPRAIRTFKVERIRTARLLDEKYTIPKEFDPSEYLKDAWSIWMSEGQPETIRLHFSPQVAKRAGETLWHHTQSISCQPDGSLIWEAQIADWREMLPWVRGWGSDVEVLQPEGLRKRMKREAKRLAKVYGVGSIEDDIPKFYAHSRPDVDESEWQLLKDHLTATSELAAQMGQAAGIAELTRVAALLHDLGKYSQEFQARLHGSKHKADHATAGAREIVQLFPKQPYKMLAELLSFAIAGHHTGLPDYGNMGDVGEEGTLLARREKKKLPDYGAYKSEIDTKKIEIQPPRLRINREHPGFSLSFLTRMVFSTLVDADWLETERYMNDREKPRGQYASIETLTGQLNQYLKRFENPQSPINLKRTETLRACMGKATEEPGFFTLTVPTGGGKTLSSMAFALNHAKEHGLQRVIYVIPFTSIIEQNAAVFRDALDDLGIENVLEHHSNFNWDGLCPASDDETNLVQKKLKLAAENWDIPIVVTTNVQFFESLFASKKSRARKLHNIAKSVIIFDEVQMLPRGYLKPCLLAVQELVTNYGDSVVFCTATQPALQRFFPRDISFTELAPDPQALFDFYRRVEVKNLGTQSDDVIVEQLNAHGQALCIVNTRRHARGLYDMLEGDGKFHLSTLMCPAHRQQILAEVRRRLRDGEPCRVVSTSVMEAGIDVDFPVGYRALAGLDSIIQAAGRVNREMKQSSGEMFVFDPDTEFIKRTPAYIEQTGAVAQSTLREHAADPTTIEAIAAYYNMLYTLHDERSFDVHKIIAYLDHGANRVDFDFKAAAENFRLIDQNTMPVIIPFDDTARDLIARLPYVQYPVSLLRRLQIYTVNVYEREFANLQSKGVIQTIADTYHVLDKTHLKAWYKEDTGLTLADDRGGEGIFVDR